MAIEITGKVLQLLEVQTGEGRNGPWQKGGFVMEVGDRFPKKVCLQVWGDMLGQVNALKVGESVKAFVDIESREYNGRWYTDIRPWKLEKVETTPVDTSASYNPPPASKTNESQEENNTGTPSSFEDDLPF